MSRFKFLSSISIIVTILVIGACQLSEEDAKNFSNMVDYFKDPRTNLCFAVMASDSKTLTCVPCTQEVEFLIVNKQKSDSACKN